MSVHLTHYIEYINCDVGRIQISSIVSPKILELVQIDFTETENHYYQYRVCNQQLCLSDYSRIWKICDVQAVEGVENNLLTQVERRVVPLLVFEPNPGSTGYLVNEFPLKDRVIVQYGDPPFHYINRPVNPTLNGLQPSVDIPLVYGFLRVSDKRLFRSVEQLLDGIAIDTKVIRVSKGLFDEKELYWTLIREEFVVRVWRLSEHHQVCILGTEGVTAQANVIRKVNDVFGIEVVFRFNVTRNITCNVDSLSQ